MTTANQTKLQKLVTDVVNSCKGTTWEAETIKNLRNELKTKLGMRDILIDLYLKNHFA